VVRAVRNVPKTEKIVKEVLAEKGINASVEKITEFSEIARLGVFATPAVVVGGKIKCTGKTPSRKGVLSWLE